MKSINLHTYYLRYVWQKKKKNSYNAFAKIDRNLSGISFFPPNRKRTGLSFSFLFLTYDKFGPASHKPNFTP